MFTRNYVSIRRWKLIKIREVCRNGQSTKQSASSNLIAGFHQNVSCSLTHSYVDRLFTLFAFSDRDTTSFQQLAKRRSLRIAGVAGCQETLFRTQLDDHRLEVDQMVGVDKLTDAELPAENIGVCHSDHLNRTRRRSVASYQVAYRWQVLSPNAATSREVISDSYFMDIQLERLRMGQEPTNFPSSGTRRMAVIPVDDDRSAPP